MPNLVSLTFPIPRILDKIQAGVFNFRFLVKSFKDNSCLKSRTSYDADMRLGQLSKLDQRNTTNSKKLLMTSCWEIRRHCHFSDLRLIWSNSEAECMVHDSYFFINNDLLSNKAENRTEKSLTQLLYYCFEKKVIFLPKNTDFLQKKKC